MGTCYIKGNKCSNVVYVSGVVYGPVVIIVTIMIIVITRSTRRAQTSARATGSLMLLNCPPFGMSVSLFVTL